MALCVRDETIMCCVEQDTQLKHHPHTRCLYHSLCVGRCVEGYVGGNLEVSCNDDSKASAVGSLPQISRHTS